MENFNLYNGLLCFGLSIVLNTIWALYVRRTTSGHKVQSSILAACTMLVSAINTVFFVKNHYNIFFSVLGAFCGTYITFGLEKMWSKPAMETNSPSQK